MKWIFTFYLCLYSLGALSYELLIVQGLSKTNQTFLTRNTFNDQISHQVFEGQRATFTANNVSIIARAINVTQEFIQWEIINDYTDVPFRKGDIVTKYDTKEHLWALNPEEAKRRYMQTQLYRPRRSIEASFSIAQALSQSVTETDAQNVDRGGYQVEGTFRHEFSYRWALAYGIRYATDIINGPDSSIKNQQLLGIIEGRFYFDPMENFFNAQVGLGIGFGFGQSYSTDPNQSISGNAVLIPSSKLSLMLPINKEYDMEIVGAFESIRLEETNADGVDQTTNLTQTKIGLLFRHHL